MRLPCREEAWVTREVGCAVSYEGEHTGVEAGLGGQGSGKRAAEGGHGPQTLHWARSRFKAHPGHTLSHAWEILHSGGREETPVQWEPYNCQGRWFTHSPHMSHSDIVTNA